MNLKNMLVAGTATVAGVAGGVAVYQLTAPPEFTPSQAAPAAAATPKARAPKGEVRFAPCRPPAVLEGGKCVTTQVQTVTLPAPAAPAPAPAAPAAPAAPKAAAPAAPKAAAPAPAVPKAPAAAPASHAPASQPAEDTGNEGEGYPDDSDCRKLREGDYDNAKEKAELKSDCEESKAEDAEDDDHSGSGSSGSGSSDGKDD